MDTYIKKYLKYKIKYLKYNKNKNILGRKVEEADQEINLEIR